MSDSGLKIGLECRAYRGRNAEGRFYGSLWRLQRQLHGLSQLSRWLRHTMMTDLIWSDPDYLVNWSVIRTGLFRFLFSLQRLPGKTHRLGAILSLHSDAQLIVLLFGKGLEVFSTISLGPQKTSHCEVTVYQLCWCRMCHTHVAFYMVTHCPNALSQP